MPASSICPGCGGPLSDCELDGLCPKCVAAQVLGPERAGAQNSNETAKSKRPPLRFFAGYELLEEIARGGMGVVYKARQVSLNRFVAVKMILAGWFASQSDIKRFLAEAEAAANLEHPNIVPIYEVGEENGQHYFSMRLIEGMSLAHLIADCGLRFSDLRDRRDEEGRDRYNAIAELMATVARAVHYAHERGILHRDLKPANILIGLNGQPHVTDFGLAKRLTASEISALSGRLTLTGAMLGTPDYMAPEQARGNLKHLTTSADIYSLGAILYHLLTGQPPFAAATPLETLRKAVDEEPLPPSQVLHERLVKSDIRNPKSEIPKDIETICLKCLSKDPTRRYASADDLTNDLKRFVRDEPIVARPAGRIEQSWRWCRRKPALATLSASLLIIFAAGLAGVLWQWRRAEEIAVKEAGERKLAEQASLKTQEANARLIEAMTRLEIQKAEDLLVAGETPTALAYLARLLRQQPTNQVVAQRIISILGHREIPLPLTAPMSHPAPVQMAEFSPDDSYVVSWATDHRLRAWDAHTGEPLAKGIESDVYHFFNREGNLVFRVSSNQAQDIKSGPVARSVRPVPASGKVIDGQLTSSGQMLLTLDTQGTVKLWETKTTSAKPVPVPLQITKDLAPVRYAFLSQSGTKAATIHTNHVAYVWETATGRPLCGPLPFHYLDAVSICMRFSPDEEKVLMLVSPGVAQIVSVKTGQIVGEALRHQGPIGATQFSPDGERLITCSDDYTARIWDAATGQALCEPLRHQSWVHDARWSPDGRRVLTASADRTARVWDGCTGQPLSEPLRHNSAVRFASFSHDGSRVVTASEDQTARIWDVRPAAFLSESMRHENYVVMAQFSPDGTKIASTSPDKTVRLWDARTGQLLIPPLQHDGQVRRAVFSADGLRLATVSIDGYVRFWDVNTGTLLHPPLKQAGQAWTFQFSPDEQQFLVATRAAIAQVWDSHTFEPITPPLRHDDDSLNSAEFSADARRVVTTSRDRTARVWDARTGDQLLLLRHDHEVNRATFSPDGEWIATAEGNWGGTGATDGAARVWNAHTGQLRFPPLHHNARVAVVRFSPQADKLLTTSEDGTARLWDARTGLPLVEPMEHPNQVHCAEFTPDGQRVVTGCNDNAVRLWDARTGLRLSEVFRHSAGNQGFGISSVNFNRDGQWLVSSAMDCTIQIWDVQVFPGTIPGWLPELAEVVAARRFTEAGGTEPVGFGELVKLKTQVGRSAASDDYTRWAKWFFGDRSTRAISPNSPVTVPQYVQQRIEENTFWSLQEAVRLAPTNALALARLARNVLEQDPNQNPRRYGEAEFLSRHAVELDANNTAALEIRLEVTEKVTRSKR